MANRYWVGGSGTWDASSTTHWSTASGSASGASVPTSSDSVFFDQAGTYTVTLGTSAALNCLDWTVSAGTVTFSGTPTSWNIYGSIDLIAGTVCSFTLSNSTFVLRGTNNTINTHGTVFTNAGIGTAGTTPKYTLANDLTCVSFNILGVSTGSNTAELNLAGYTLTLSGTTSSTLVCNAGSLLNFGVNGSVVLTSGGVSVTSVSAFRGTSGTGTIRMNGSAVQFTGNGNTFTGMTLVKGGTGTLTISGSNTLSDIQNATQPVTFNFNASTVTTVTNFNVNGTSGNLVTLKSSVAGTQFSISKASGTVTLNYLSIKDSAATGGASWNANLSTDAGNNSGWTISSGTGAVTIALSNTNLSATGEVGNVTIAVGQILDITNTGLSMTGSVGDVTLFIGSGVIVGLSGVSGTGRVGSVTIAIIQNASVTLTGVYATGVVSNTPLNIWISVDTNQTANWIPVAT